MAPPTSKVLRVLRARDHVQRMPANVNGSHHTSLPHYASGSLSLLSRPAKYRIDHWSTVLVRVERTVLELGLDLRVIVSAR